MGKKSKYPKYSTGSVDINGQSIATAQKNKKNTINSSYTMSDTEKAIYDGIQENLATSLQDLFTISDETQQKWDQQIGFDRSLLFLRFCLTQVSLDKNTHECSFF